MHEKIEDVLQDFCQKSSEDVTALTSIATQMVYIFQNVYVVHPFTLETVPNFTLSKFFDYFSFPLLSLLAIYIFKCRYPFMLETENYTLHLPEFVDHFCEWDRNKDSFITMDEVIKNIILKPYNECLC